MGDGDAARRGWPAVVALVDDCEVISIGLRHLLSPCDDLRVVEASGDEIDADIILFDPVLPRSGGAEHLRRLLDRDGGRVVVFTWDADRVAAEHALVDGARGCLSKSLPGRALAMDLRRILAGQVVVDWGDLPPVAEVPAAVAVERARLSRREVEVLELIGRGVTNEEIAQVLFLSPNSIKSYIRSAYRKIGVERRSQAVLWVHQHGLGPAASDPDADRPASPEPPLDVA